MALATALAKRHPVVQERQGHCRNQAQVRFLLSNYTHASCHRSHWQPVGPRLNWPKTAQTFKPRRIRGRRRHLAPA